MYTLQDGGGQPLPCTDRCAITTKFTKLRRLCLLLCVLLTAVVKIAAQEITLDVKNEAFAHVLDEIKKQSQYDVFYNKSLLREAKNVTLKVEKAPLKEVLEKVFDNQPFNYSIANNTIVVTPRKKPETIMTAANDLVPFQGSQGEVIKGRVLDYKSKPMAGVLVQYDQSYFFTYTSSDGEFSIPGTKGTIISFSVAGYTDRELRYDGEDFLLVQMEPVTSQLQNVKVQSYAASKVKDPTTHIDLTNRSYMNLGQVLQGTIPGLTLQTVSTSTTTVTGVEVFVNQQYRFVHFTLEQFLDAYPARGQQIIDALLSGNIPSWLNKNVYHLTTNTTVTTSLVPQLRGVNTFASNTSGMLIVIDGFPKDGFPSDYSMNNVESIEVVKDPKELIKWGPRAAGGAILIKSKQGRSGQLQINYATNMYYMPAPKYSRSQLQQANSRDVLDYLAQSDSLFQQNTYIPSTAFNISPAQRLLALRYNNLITTDQFNKSYDSLGQLSNEAQIRNLQRNAFSHNHTLSLTGGSRNYKFSIIGGYNSTGDNSINGYTRTASLNMNHSFNLLNDKLSMNLLVYVNDVNSRAGYNINPSNMQLQPYQMLLDGKGNYIYDYSLLNQDANTTLMKAGYYNYGVNILEDARLNKNTTRSNQQQARFNFNWKLLPGLQWTGSFYYSGQNNTNDLLYDKQSSYVRQLVDQYGEYHATGINYYVPYGDILQRSKSTNDQWNLRSGLSYSRSIGKSDIEFSIGAGAASTEYKQPASATTYGYNASTKTGAPVFLSTPDPKASITNFYVLFPGAASSIYPGNLIVPVNLLNTVSRNMNWNGSVKYQYDHRFTLSAGYNSVYSPNYGQTPLYSTMSLYSADASLKLFKRPVSAVMDNISVFTGLSGTKMPDLPLQYTNTRYQQVDWTNYTIWVSGYSPTQQTGQRTENLYQGVKLEMWQGKLEAAMAYNSLHATGSTSSTSLSNSQADSSYTQHYISAGVKANMRKGLLTLALNYSKSPEGQSQVNGDARYDIAKESYFHSALISSLETEVQIENVSPYQAMGLMMGTNVASAGSYTMATNSSFTTLPPKNTNYEVRARIGIKSDAYTLDLRYYNHTTGGLSNSISVATDVSSGLSSQYSYSTITNKGMEFFLKNNLVRNNKFSYTLTLNGAYNVNLATQVPPVAFTATDGYATSYHDGYNTSNVWAYKWAGLDNKGNPQIYNNKGEKTSVLDSSTLASSLVYSGTFKAPWTGGVIQDATFGQFFARVAVTFNWGGVMRRYVPSPSGTLDNSALIRNRWKKAGDELYTDVPAMTSDGPGSYREYVVHNSSATILSANMVRLQETMIGWRLPGNLLKYIRAKNGILTMQVQNLAFWSQNKYHLDPTTVGSNGVIGMPLAKQYSCSINISF